MCTGGPSQPTLTFQIPKTTTHHKHWHYFCNCSLQRSTQITQKFFNQPRTGQGLLTSNFVISILFQVSETLRYIHICRARKENLTEDHMIYKWDLHPFCFLQSISDSEWSLQAPLWNWDFSTTCNSLIRVTVFLSWLGRQCLKSSNKYLQTCKEMIQCCNKQNKVMQCSCVRTKPSEKNKPKSYSCF